MYKINSTKNINEIFLNYLIDVKKKSHIELNLGGGGVNIELNLARVHLLCGASELV